MTDRRRFLLSGFAALATFAAGPALSFDHRVWRPGPQERYRPLDFGRRPAPAEPPTPSGSQDGRGEVVSYFGDDAPGTLIVDTADRALYLVLDGSLALRYAIAVGRDGFSWSGEAVIGRKAEWPAWYPPASMRERQPELPEMMEGGPDNPLGARAIYLYENGRDTLYRIHGTNEPGSIGRAVSSGCIRMLNDDVIEVYDRVTTGAKVVVLPHDDEPLARS